MDAIDFEYDKQWLSDFGFIVCYFDKSGNVDRVDTGSTITFNKVRQKGGYKHSLTSTEYDDCITTTFDLCKNPDLHDDMEITNDEYRDLVRWLHRKEYLRFRFINDEDETTCYYNASFNVKKIELHGVLYGLELTMETDSPFGYGEEYEFEEDMIPGQEYEVYDVSDEMGCLCPTIVITAQQSGDLILENKDTETVTSIKNLVAGEVITIDGMTLQISTDREGHKICNDFNYEFPRIANSYDERANHFTASIKCNMRLTYLPIIKGFVY